MLTDEQLENSRIKSALGLFTYALLRPYFESENGINPDLIDRNLELMLDLRKATIDELEMRGIHNEP